MLNTSTFSDALADHDLQPRQDLTAVLDLTWQRLAEPGTWLTGAQRIAIAQCTRAAWHCAGCNQRQAALSPYAESVTHDATGDLPPEWIELIHITTRDSGRMTERSVNAARTAGISDDEFIEIVTVAIMTQMADAFSLGIGLPLVALPTPVDGEPPRVRSETATPGPGWLPTIAPDDVSAEFADFYADGYGNFFVRRALTLVPAQARQLWDLGDQLYLPDPRVPELEGIERDISRAQMEFLAARSSALLGCFY